MNITTRIQTLQRQIVLAERFYHRPLGSVTLLAVSKQHAAHAVTEAFQAGLVHFGENYLQEALIKMNALSHLPICWHYIGVIQRKKTTLIAQHFDWVHTVSSQLIADRLNEARPEALGALNVCIQLNLDDENSKAGIQPKEAAELADYILTLPRLKLRGLMIIPRVELDPEKQYESFLRATSLLNTLNQRNHGAMDTLSMGMSHDFQSAIRAGSTMVRIGTSIFGQRDQA